MKHARIEMNPEIMGGKPVVRGTRIPVETILRKLGAGMTTEAVLADHPRLSADDIRAAQAFAADYLADEDVAYG
ncbi:antitoxin [Rhodoplanes elegans]|uniref:Antitoxin n=2 Tax=Rhodoplanes elegans TaxID=29408 RepID=A0A327KIN0_9BRAD|nr:antitoxin [Rhodoplanes elegans]RAI38006.1 antitoxin [Rhodoplanes elegans]